MTDPDFLWQLIAVSSVGLNAVILVRKLFGGAERRTIDQPLSVKPAEQYVTREVCDLHHRDQATRLAGLERRIEGCENRFESLRRDLIDAGEQRAVKIHDRINDVLAVVSKLVGRIDEITRPKKP
jgi:hypothetical protein